GTLIIANSPPLSIAAGQVIPIAEIQGHLANPKPDRLTYDGVPYPVHTTYPVAYNFTAPSTDPALRSPLNWYAEVQVGPRQLEYVGIPQWSTTKSGGVFVTDVQPLTFGDTISAYEHVAVNNTMDGTRLNALVSPYSNLVEDPNPANSGIWWGVQIDGRVFKIDRNGNTTTVYGRKRDRTRLTLGGDSQSGGFNNITSSDVEAIQTFVGTPPPYDMDGANDLCFDPRDSN